MRPEFLEMEGQEELTDEAADEPDLRPILRDEPELRDSSWWSGRNGSPNRILPHPLRGFGRSRPQATSVACYLASLDASRSNPVRVVNYRHEKAPRFRAGLF